MPYVLLACLDDHRGEVGSLERSAAHEGAVNVGLGDELGDAGVLDGDETCVVKFASGLRI